MGTPTALRVATFNIRHGKGLDGKIDLARTAEDILKTGASVVALQEVDRHMMRSGFADQLARLCALTGMDGRFAPSINFGWSQYGNALLSKHPFVRYTARYLPGSMERRSVLTADIDIAGQSVTFVNTHLGLLDKEKRKQIPLLLTELAHVPKPAVLLGDFNMAEDHPRMRWLLIKWAKISLADPQSTMRNPWRGGEIDHILINKPAKRAAAWVEQSVASDHVPVVADIMWDGREAGDGRAV